MNARPLIGLVFAGGTLATAGSYAPFLWRRSVLAGAGAVCVVLIFVCVVFDGFFFYKAAETRSQAFSLAAHYAVFCCAGISVLALSFADLWRQRNVESALLCLWLLGAFVFATFVNWSVTARTILPMAVPAGILVARRLGADGTARPLRWWPLVPAALLSLWVAYGDFESANSARAAAQRVASQAERYPGKYWFMGHWGYQYYLEEKGLRFLTPEAAAGVHAGDRVAIFRWLTLAPASFHREDVVAVPDAGFHEADPAFVSTHHPLTRSGFYSSVLGPLPYTLGPAPDVDVDVFEFRDLSR